MAVKTPKGWYDISVSLKQGLSYFPTDPVPCHSSPAEIAARQKCGEF
jgi:hypothetical protein